MSPERRQFRSTAIQKNNYHGEGYCVCCLNYKGKEVEGRELKLHRLTADKKLRKVRWSPLSETGQKVTACLKLFNLIYVGQNSFSNLILLKNGVGVYIIKEDSQQNHQARLCAIITVTTLQTMRHAAKS